MTEATPGPRLREAQRRLRKLISAPSDSPAGREAREREIAALLRGDARRPAALRLEVYAHAWFERLHGVLAADFPALAQALGADGFRELALGYLRSHPPQQPSLRDAGARLPVFLARSPRTAELRRRHAFAADLARLEWALVEAFDAADAPPLARDALAALPPEAWEGLRLALQPALRLLALAWPVPPLRAAHDRGEASLPVPLEARTTHVCVWRSEERVFHRVLDPVEAEALRLARDGVGFGGLCERLGRRLSDEQAPLHAASLLARWLEDGLLVSPEC